MANKTIALSSELYAGQSGLKLYLLNKTTGAIGNNASGDTLTPGSNGLFTTIVDEAITGWWKILVKDSSDNSLIENGWVYIASDTASTFIVDDPSVFAKITDVAVTVYPLSSVLQETTIEGTTIKTWVGSKATVGPFAIFDANGDPVSLTDTYEIVVSRGYRTDVLVIPHASITIVDNQFSFSVDGATSNPETLQWAFKRIDINDPLAKGPLIVQNVANKDTLE